MQTLISEDLSNWFSNCQEVENHRGHRNCFATSQKLTIPQEEESSLDKFPEILYLTAKERIEKESALKIKSNGRWKALTLLNTSCL